MAYSPQDVKIGTCDVSFNSVDLGLTKGGVTLSFATKKIDINRNCFGSVTPGSIIAERTIKVKVPMAESSFANLKTAIPGSVLTINATKKRLDVNTDRGVNTFNYAGALVLTPTNSVDENEKITVPIAAPDGSFSISYTHDKERVIEVEFEGVEDANGLLFFFGDATA